MGMKIKSRGIQFLAEMITAILNDRKSQTRRVIKDQPRAAYGEPYLSTDGNTWFWHEMEEYDRFTWRDCHYGKPGDLLWLREKLIRDSAGKVAYAHNGKRVKVKGATVKWTWKRKTLPARYCPRWASRITLKITDVRAQRLQSITPSDAMTEGIQIPVDEHRHPLLQVSGNLPDHPLWTKKEGRTIDDYRTGYFALLWESNNAVRGYPWKSNPWVWAITFRRLKK